MRGIQPLIFALLTVGSVLPINAQIDRITGKNFATRSEVLATHGMVCTSVPAATEVGVEILKRGGSAVDAAIAANATLGLMEPVSNGVGGDLFAIVYSAKENKLYGINGSGRSPLGLSYDQMKAELAKLKRTTIPPNGQGIATLQILNILEGFDLKAMGRNSPETLHTMIEAKKIAWADRAKFYADPAFSKIPLAGLLSKKYAAERRKLIDPDRAAKQVEAGNPALDQSDTIYMCTADDEGNLVSLIQSNYRGMGSGIVVPGLGFMFQDRGELFSMDPQHANVYAPGKRPFHTIIPGFVMKDGKPWEAFGVMGGGMQPQGHVQVLTNQIDFGLNVQEAGDASRWQHEGDNEPTGEKMTASGGYVEVESGIPYETVRELRKKGHDVRFDVGGYGGYQAIKVEMHDGRRVYVGASESRKDGMAAGY